MIIDKKKFFENCLSLQIDKECRALLHLSVTAFTYITLQNRKIISFYNSKKEAFSLEFLKSILEEKSDNAIKNRGYLLCESLLLEAGKKSDFALFPLNTDCCMSVLYEKIGERTSLYLFQHDCIPESFVNALQDLRKLLRRFVFYLKNQIDCLQETSVTIEDSSFFDSFFDFIEQQNLSDGKDNLFSKDFVHQELPILAKEGVMVFLSPKQSQLMTGFSFGLSYQDIEEEYGIKRKAAELYLNHIKAKTNWPTLFNLIDSFRKTNPWITEDTLIQEKKYDGKNREK